MARDLNGFYNLPLADVVPDTTIESVWANTTLGDIKTEMEDSLSRSGKGGMSSALKAFSGTGSLPGYTFSAEVDSGIYRASSGDLRVAISGIDQMRWKDGQVSLWNQVTSLWDDLLTLNAIGLSLETQTLAAGQLVVVFTNDVSNSAFFVNGDDVDNGRLAVTTDYTYTLATKTLTLTQSYPVGTTLSAQRISGIDSLTLEGKPTYQTVASMKLADLAIGTLVETAGFTTAGDDEGGTYLIAVPQVVDDVVDHTLTNGNVALHQFQTIFGAGAGDVTIKSGSANNVNSAGFYEVAPNIWVPYVTDPSL